MSNLKLRITVIGCGNVGNAVAMILLNRASCAIELNVMEPSKNQQGRLLELSHIAGLHQIHQFTLNDLNEFAQADVIYHTAGRCMKANESRLDVAEGNLQLTRQIFNQVTFTKQPLILVLTNPVDVITYFVREQTQLPIHKVIGTGTLLDSARFSAILQKLEVTQHHTPAWVIGEHGDSMVLLYSKLNSQSIIKTLDEELKHQITNETVFAAKRIKQTQDHTSSGVASVAVMIMDYILGDITIETPFPVSCVTDEALQTKLELNQPIAISWFFDLKNEAKSLQNISISEKEMEQFKLSANILVSQIEKLKYIR